MHDEVLILFSGLVEATQIGPLEETQGGPGMLCMGRVRRGIITLNSAPEHIRHTVKKFGAMQC